jgi:hypothetical protein
MAGVSAVGGTAVVVGAVVSTGAAVVVVAIDVDSEGGAVVSDAPSSDELHPAARAKTRAIAEVNLGTRGK